MVSKGVLVFDYPPYFTWYSCDNFFSEVENEAERITF